MVVSLVYKDTAQNQFVIIKSIIYTYYSKLPFIEETIIHIFITICNKNSFDIVLE